MGGNYRGRPMQVSVVFKLIMIVSAICLTHAAFAQVKDDAVSASSTLVTNRAVLSVGRQVFTAVDATAMLLAWNMTATRGEETIKFQTNLLENLSLGETSRVDPLIMMKKWPDDVRTFFQMAMIWVDVQKLNLFVAREQEITALLRKFKDYVSAPAEGVPATLMDGVRVSSDTAKKKWIESVVRVRSFIRVRGDLERNRNLFSAGWYWQTLSSEDSVKK